MTEKRKNAPVATHRDGALSSKVWQNHNKDGDPYYSVTFQRTYTNAQDKPAETNSFSRNDLLKVKELASESYRTIGIQREMDKEQSRERAQEDKHEQAYQEQQEQEPEQSLAEQRDAAFENAAPPEQYEQDQEHSREHEPERG